eukprot:3105235-Rhodomonas_salina.2
MGTVEPSMQDGRCNYLSLFKKFNARAHQDADGCPGALWRCAAFESLAPARPLAKRRLRPFSKRWLEPLLASLGSTAAWYGPRILPP